MGISALALGATGVDLRGPKLQDRENLAALAAFIFIYWHTIITSCLYNIAWRRLFCQTGQENYSNCWDA